MLRVLLVADESFSREALARALEQDGVGTVSVASTAAEAAAHDPPDVILLDVTSPERLDDIHRLTEALPASRLLALGVREREADVVRCIEAGAVGYAARSASLGEIAYRISRAMRDEPVASPQVIAALMRRVASLAADRRQPHLQELTSREREVIGLIEAGLSNKEIAERLSIEVTTVKNHVHRILEKLRLHRRGEAAALLRRAELPAPGSTPAR